MYYGTFTYKETLLSKGTLIGIVCKYDKTHKRCSTTGTIDLLQISADIGGMLGCFIGGSIISIVEMLLLSAITLWDGVKMTIHHFKTP